MINVGLALLLTILIVISLLGMAGVTYIITMSIIDSTIVKPLCGQATLSSLVDISDQPCVINPIGTTNKRYTRDYANHVIAVPYAVSYRVACATICDSITSDGSCIGTTQQVNNYTQCIDKLKPDIGCSDIAIPIARVGSTPYYMETFYGNTNDTDPKPIPPPRTTTCII